MGKTTSRGSVDRAMGYTTAPEGWWQDFVSALPARTAKLAVTRRDGSPHIAPVWVDLDVPADGDGSDDGGSDGDGALSGGPDGDGSGVRIVFMTSADTIKGKSILRDGRVALCFDDERPPFAFVTISGTTTTSTDPDELLAWGTRIGGRYMGAELAEQYGRRNAVPPEMVVWVTPERIVAKIDVAD